MRLRRYPAGLQRSRLGHLGAGTHLVADLAEPDSGVRRSADVLLVPAERAESTFESTTESTFESATDPAARSTWRELGRGLAGCALIAVERPDGGCLALLPDGRRLTAVWQERPAWASFAVAASVVHEQLSGESAPGGVVRVAAGAGQPAGLLLVSLCRAPG